ncbi:MULTISPECIES: hypothetical protein [unclassified Clostridioides]|uniref:hypothetical protein n=1 Tax=unclassified Clostridioides TaxID=2635829 RepID=UPI001D125F25|nr:hypothetical protein [Clostridioides sp. ZZV15-6597]MCC0732139.1 hypothetical protein [Clostridioides sp. ZZV14-6048]MCC0739989.1 hypothetical protein [Clostridioides sp. ZZV14-5902]
MNGDKNIKFTKVDEKRMKKRKKQKEIQKEICPIGEYEEGKIRVSTNLPISIADALIYHTKIESIKENSRSELLENIIISWAKENISEELLKEG